MRKYILLTLLIFYVIILPAIVEETASFKGFIYGEAPTCQYDNWVSHLAEKIVSPGYNVYSPWDRQTSGMGDFHIPTTDNLANWSLIIDAFLVQDWVTVDGLITSSGFPYQLVQFNDTDTNRTYYMLREIPNDLVDDNGTLADYDDETGFFGWGWGLYIYNPTGDQRTIITVPHPCDDFIAPTLSSIAFEKWNATYMLIAGAGREVAWTNVAPYTNSKSLSDPTRTNNHPWYPAYTKFCNNIRTVSGKREFSAQIHSYDWSLHTGFANLQISAGYNRMCPNLPIRDLSRFKRDLINRGSHLMIPANTIGSNSDVYLNDYYTVQYNIHPFTYNSQNNPIDVNNYMDLPAYSQNVQMNYTLTGWNDYDVFDPFFHVEMSELPNCYVQNTNNFKWFYGWNATTQTWDMQHLFDKPIQYYSYWINDMNSVLGRALTMNDNQAPQNPSNLSVINQSYDNITLQWQVSDDYDFDTYEVLYGTQPIGTSNYSLYTRSNDAFLASPLCNQINVSGLTTGTQYYFKVRAKDKNGNYSDLTDEVNAITSPAKITAYRAIGLDNKVAVKWTAINQTNNLGFRVYKYTPGGEFTLVDSYLTNPALLTGVNNYVWIDTLVTNNDSYTYKISSISNTDLEFVHNSLSTAYPRDYFNLYVSKGDYTLQDSLSFSANPSASSGSDSDYDITKANAPTSNFVYGAFFEQYWGNNGTYLQQEVYGDFDPQTDVKTWAIRVKSDQINTPLLLRIDDSFNRYSEKLYIKDNSTGVLTDLESGGYTFTVTDLNYKYFTLYWGNLQPAVSITTLPNRIYQGGSSQPFYWGTTYNFLVDHYALSIQNDTDSLFVVDNLPATTSNYYISFPIDHEMQDAKFVLDTWSLDGQLQRKTSAFTFAIVPLNISVAPEPGLYTKSNIWTNGSFNISSVFGSGASGWVMDVNGAWQPSSTFSFGQGTWIQKENVFEYTSNAPIQKDSLSFALQAGWNLIPNPHICSYGIEDLRFRINNLVYSFAEMMDQKLISRGIYVYRNDRYELTNIINQGEAFLIKYYGPVTFNPFITFIPFNAGTSVQPPTPLWALNIKAGQTDSDTDEVEIGSNQLCTDSYEFNFDLPEPPMKPVLNQTRLYIYRSHNETEFLDNTLNHDYRTAFTDNPLEEKVWNFRLDVANTNPVNFTVDTALFPETYGANISIGDFSYDIQHGNQFTFNPANAGTFNGEITIHNYFTGNDDVTLAPIYGLQVFPNPFNPETQIAFNTGSKGNVDVNIYNIKGQLVRTLSKGQLAKGNHKLIWNGKDNHDSSVGTGIYFVKIAAQNKVKTIKMMLMK